MKKIALSLSLSLVALAVFFIPGAAELLQYDRVEIGDGQLWRLATGHFTHFTDNHLFWDVVAFGVLGAVCERRNRRTFLFCLGLSIVFISASVWVGLPSLRIYRGLSGVDSALFALLAAQLLREGMAERRWPAVSVMILLLIGFIGKTVFEQLTGATLFVANTSEMVPVPLAHLAGAAAGLVAGFFNAHKKRNYAENSEFNLREPPIPGEDQHGSNRMDGNESSTLSGSEINRYRNPGFRDIRSTRGYSN